MGICCLFFPKTLPLDIDPAATGEPTGQQTSVTLRCVNEASNMKRYGQIKQESNQTLPALRISPTLSTHPCRSICTLSSKVVSQLPYLHGRPPREDPSTLYDHPFPPLRIFNMESKHQPKQIFQPSVLPMTANHPPYTPRHIHSPRSPHRPRISQCRITRHSFFVVL